MDEETGPAPSNRVPMGSVRAAALTAALVLAACGGGDGDSSSVTLPADGTTSTSTNSTTSTTEDPDAALEAEIEEAYYAQWDAFIEIFSDPDPTNPLIDKHFTGEQRERLLSSISDFTRDGTALRRPDDPANFAPAVGRIDIRNGAATVEACVVDGLVVVREATGEVVNDAVATLDLQVEFVLEDGKWKVADTNRTARREGVAQCFSEAS